ncbi:MAG: EpsG family protein [Agathobacter sp.]|nr:EpsG family protein [Agathobacter sp.]MBQ2283503.1 EpsG family protein [Agathobacter sp.]
MAAWVILSIICPIFALPTAFKGMRQDIRHWKLYAFLFAAFFGAIAYNYVPIIESDLTRYIAEAGKMQGKTLLSVMIADTERLFVKDIWFWLIAQIGDYQLIPAISTFVVYYTGAYIAGYMAYSGGMEKVIHWQLMLLICALDLTIVVNYVRNICAFAIVILAFFKWRVENRQKLLAFFLIIMGIFIHSTAIVLVLVLLLLPVIRRCFWQFLIGFLLAGNIINLLYQQLGGIGGNIVFDIISGIIYKAYQYFNGMVATEWASQLNQSFTSQAIKIFYLFVITAIVVTYLVQRYNQKGRSNLAVHPDFSNYILMIGALSLGCIPVETPAYNRFYSAFILGSPVLLFELFYSKKINVKWLYLLSYIGIVKWLYSISYEIDLTKLAGIIMTNPVFMIIKWIFLEK